MDLVRPEFLHAVRTRREELGRSWSTDEAASYEAHLGSLISEAVMGVRVSLSALLSIIEDGRFKTRHEGSMSKNPERSIDEETAVWQLDPSRPETYPIFGYAASIDDVSCAVTRAALHSPYGGARVLLSPAIRIRTTVFFGDSLWWNRTGRGAPASVDGPYELAWPYDRGCPLERTSLDECSVDEAVELQIIGGIALDEIDAVVFDFEPPTELEDALRGADIGWSVNPMPRLPEWLVPQFVRDELDATQTSSEQ